MPITEFVQLTLTTPISPSPSPSTPTPLQLAIRKSVSIMRLSSHHPSVFFTDTHNPSKMCVLGGWPTQHAHQHGFSGSAEQKDLIAEIGELMGIAWMEYLGVDLVGEEGVMRGHGGGGGDGDDGDGEGEGNGDGDGEGKGVVLNVSSAECVVAIIISVGDLDGLAKSRSGFTSSYATTTTTTAAATSTSASDAGSSTSISSAAKALQESIETRITHKLTTITNPTTTTTTNPQIIQTWNLKKRQQDSEDDYLVLFRTFDDVQTAGEWGDEVEKVISGVDGVKSVEVLKFRRAEY